MDLANEALFKKRDGAKRLNTDIYWASLLYLASDLSDILNAENVGKDVKKLPLSLGEALDRLAEDEIIKSAMPDEMYKVFHWDKNDEWEKFLGATTQWDLDTYLDCLP